MRGSYLVPSRCAASPRVIAAAQPRSAQHSPAHTAKAELKTTKRQGHQNKNRTCSLDMSSCDLRFAAQPGWPCSSLAQHSHSRAPDDPKTYRPKSGKICCRAEKRNRYGRGNVWWACCHLFLSNRLNKNPPSQIGYKKRLRGFWKFLRVERQ